MRGDGREPTEESESPGMDRDQGRQRSRRLLAVTMAVVTLSTAATAGAGSLIVGGSPAAPGSWPSIVALVDPAAPDASLGRFCGGTLVDVQWVLTAQHCTFDEVGSALVPARIDVVLGATDLSVTAGAQRIDVDQIVRAPGFSLRDLANDVALLHLAEPATLGPNVAVMDVVSPTDRGKWAGGEEVQIAGWGDTTGNGTFSNQLHEATTHAVSNLACERAYRPVALPFFQRDSMVCAGELQTGGIDSCEGDSGGPLVITGASGARALVGAVSWGVGCAQAGQPGVYSRLDAFRSFIYGPSGAITGVVPPGAPTGVVAIAGQEAATVSWSAPASTGGRSLAGYRVTVRSAGSPAVRTIETGPLTTQLDVTGLTAGDAYTFMVGAGNAAGLSVETTSEAVVPTVIPVVSVVPPTMNGSATVGGRLDADLGTWSGGPTSFAYQWQRESSSGSGSYQDIPNAATGIYEPTDADIGLRLRIGVTAIRLFSPTQTTAFSEATQPVPVPPVNATAPTISGVAQVGRTLTASPGTWSGAGQFTYQWQRFTADGRFFIQAIPDTVGVTYTPSLADVGRTLRVLVTTAPPNGTRTALSAPTQQVLAEERPGPPVSSEAPDIVGIARVGRPLQAVPGAWANTTGTPTLGWQVCEPSGESCVALASVATSRYTPTEDEIGKRLRVLVTAIGPGGRRELLSAATPPVLPKFVVDRVGPVRVRTTATGLVVITLSARTEPSARIQINVRRGAKELKVKAGRSRIAGRVPTPFGRGVVAFAPASGGAQQVVLSLAGRRSGPAQSVRLVVTVSDTNGERAVLVANVKARVSLISR